jgi:cbb3-type cytochrome oxidase maturation protein
MSVILVLVAFSVTVAIGFLIAFFWSVRNGQYDDTYSSSVRILFEDDKPPQTSTGESTPANTLNEQPQNQ